MVTRVGKILLLLACLALLASCGTNGLSGAPQSKFSNIPTGTGYQPEQGTDGKPHPLPNSHWESILVANGITYVGSDNGQLYAFDERSGRILWQRKQSANSLRAIVSGIIISTSQQDADDSVYGLDANSGALLWQHKTPDINQVQVVNGIVYVDTGNSAHAAYIYAFQPRSGTLLWQYAQGKDDLGSVSVINGRVYAAPLAETGNDVPEPQTITVLDAASGRVLWHLAIPASDGFARDGVTEANSVTYIGTGHGSVYALQAATGQLLWHVSQSTSIPGPQDITQVTPVVSGGIVFAGSPQHVFAYRAADGKQLWEYSVAINGGLEFGMQPIVAGGIVYFLTSMPRSMLVALRASDGTQLWQGQQIAIDPHSLVLANGLLVNLVGDLTAWRTGDGSQTWTRVTDNDVGPPGPGRPVLLSDGTIYLGGDDGVLHAYRLSDGSQLWQYKIPELAVREPPATSAAVTFSSKTSYDQAIQIVSDLGLKTFVLCASRWAPVDDRDYYTPNHILAVQAEPNSAPLWLNRLQATPGVTQAQAYQGVYFGCRGEINPDSPLRLSESQAGSYLRVSFAGGSGYLKAWESLNALGFRLADPCYEKARAQGHKPAWQPMGEESGFAQTHTLTLATTVFNATSWRQQLQSVPGLSAIQPLPGAGC
jgi:outer membrane protein assembly factor BamB